MIERETRGSTRILRLAHGKVNALDLGLLESLRAQLGDFAESEERALVLTGTGSVFCAGVDLKQILDQGGEYTDAFLVELTAMLRDLYLLTKPVIAAINGHAIAGGCILAAASDRRVMADDSGQGRFGVTELYVGVPFPPLALEILRAAYAPAIVRDLIYTGRLVDASEARDLGLVDELVAPDRLLSRAVEIADQLGGVVEDTFAATKTQLNRPVVDYAEEAFTDLAGETRQIWRSTAARDTMRSFFNRVVRAND